MKQFKLTALLVAFVLTANFGFAQNATDSITIPARTISLKSVSIPDIYIGEEILGGQQTKETILTNPFVIAKGSKCDGIEWTVLSYEVTFVVNGKEEASIRVTGAEFTDQIKNRIQAASSGTMIEFSDIRISSVAGTRIMVQPLIVRIR